VIFQDSENHLVHIEVNPIGGQWTSDKSLIELTEFARKYKTRYQMHTLETRYQQLFAQKKWGKSLIQHFEDLGILGPWVTLAHMVHVDFDDLQLLARRSVGIASNPSSNLRLHSGIAPLANMKSVGINIGIGLDGHSLDDDQDFIRELRLAWFLSNLNKMNYPEVTARDILSFGTHQGAEITFGKDVLLGKLEPGYLADLVLIDFETIKGLWYIPTADPVEVLLHHGCREHVEYVMVNGEWVVKKGQACTLDESVIQNEILKIFKTWNYNERVPIEKITPYVKSFYQKWTREN
jgi:5-methylthioadenosine/S-adenosylhomocysteine deaminase